MLNKSHIIAGILALVLAGAGVAANELEQPILDNDVAAVKKILAGNPKLANQPCGDGWMPLHRAALYSYHDIVKALVDAGADVHATDSEGLTVLHRIARCASPTKEILTYLLAKGADPCARGPSQGGPTPLHTAAFSGHVEVVAFLLNQGVNVDGLDPKDAESSKCATPLYSALEQSEVHVVRLLLDKGANAKLCPKDARPLIALAARIGDIDLMDRLKSLGAEVPSDEELAEELPKGLVQAIDLQNAGYVRKFLKRYPQVVNTTKVVNDGTPLIHALNCYLPLERKTDASLAVVKELLEAKAFFGDSLEVAATIGWYDAAKLLLKYGAKADQRRANNPHYPPIQAAAEHGHKDIVALLLDNGADVDGGFDDREIAQTPLRRTIRHGHVEVARLLMNRGAKFGTRYDWLDTDFAEAVTQGRRDMVELLCDKLIANDLPGQRPRAPTVIASGLHVALQQGNMKMIDFFVKRGVLPNDAGSLQYAIFSGRMEILELVLSHGPKLDETGRSGWGDNALTMAVQYNRKEMAELLLKDGASTNIKGSDRGTTALHAAQTKEWAELLVKNGAKIDVADKDGVTPFVQAVKAGNLELARFFEEKGAKHTPLTMTVLGRLQLFQKCDANPKVDDADKNGGRMLLHWAAKHGQTEIAAELLDRGADVNLATNFRMHWAQYADVTPLHLAVAGGHAKTAALLIDKGAALDKSIHSIPPPPSYFGFNDQTVHSISLMQLALGTGDAELVRLLVEKKARPGLEEADRLAAALAAAQAKHMKLVRYFVSLGVPVDTPRKVPSAGPKTPIYSPPPVPTFKDGPRLLHGVAEAGDLELAKLLLAKGATLDAADADGWRPLHRAVLGKQRAMVEFLLERGAKVEGGPSLLAMAVSQGNRQLVELFLAKGANPQDGLGTAIKNKDVETAKLLLAKGANANDGLETAIKNKDIETAKLLLAKGANPQDGLGAAIKNKDVETAKLLLAKGANANDGLDVAIQNKDIETAKLLLANGARIADGYLEQAVTDNDRPMVKLLLAHGAKAIKVSRSKRQNLLHSAIDLQNTDLVALHLDAGADLEGSIIANSTELTIKAGIVDYFLETDAKKLRKIWGIGYYSHPDQPNRHEMTGTPLQAALARQDRPTVELLLARGAQVNARFYNGAVPLHLAAHFGNLDLARLLLAKGADVNARDQAGATPIEVARRRGHQAMAELLRKAANE